MDDASQHRQLAGESCRAASGLTLPEVHHACLGSRRDSPIGGLRCLQLPLSSVEPGGLLALAAQRIPDPQFAIKTPAGRRSSRSLTPVFARLTVLPVRSPGAHLHPLLCRLPVTARCGEGDGSK